MPHRSVCIPGKRKVICVYNKFNKKSSAEAVKAFSRKQKLGQ